MARKLSRRVVVQGTLATAAVGCGPVASAIDAGTLGGGSAGGASGGSSGGGAAAGGGAAGGAAAGGAAAGGAAAGGAAAGGAAAGGAAAGGTADAGVQAGVLFHSDWSTALGNTQRALLDQAKALPWDLVIGNGSTTTVIASTGLDFPSANCLQVNGDYAGAGAQPIQTRQVAVRPMNNRWPVPDVGQSLFFRLYKRLVYPCPMFPTLGNNNHPLEEQPGGASNWSWSFAVEPAGWRPALQSQVSTRFRLGPPSAPIFLARNVTYRLEWQVHRIGATTCNLHARIFDSAGALLHGDAAFVLDSNPGQSLATMPTLNLTDVQTLDGLQVGTNGPGVDPGGPTGPMWYLGAVAVRADGWCGPYANGV